MSPARAPAANGDTPFREPIAIGNYYGLVSAEPLSDLPYVPPAVPARALQGALARARCASGESLLEASRRTTLLVVFLRHNGCTFCREALADLSRDRARLERDGARICLVLMAEDAEAEALLRRYGLDDVLRVSDPSRALYHAFGLERGRLEQLMNLSILRRAISSTLRGNVIGRTIGDPKQMPGVFVLRDGRVLRAHRHRSAADRPDYLSLIAGILPQHSATAT